MQKALVILLALATLIEVALGLGILLIPTSLMGAFHITNLNDDILYLAAIIGWLCLFTAAVAGTTARWVHQGRPEGRTLAIVLGVFWLVIGLHLGFAFNRPDHFVLDAAKGFLILILALRLKTLRKAK